jgi:hypothetical protein
MRNNKFIRPARLPRGAYAKSFEEVIEPFRKKAAEEKKRREKDDGKE